MTDLSLRMPPGCATAEPDAISPASGARVWDSLALTDSESTGLAAAYLASACGDLAGLRQAAKAGWGALDASTLARLELFARGDTTRPELMVTNLPIDSAVPLTPVSGQSDDNLAGSLGEFLMVVFSLPLGLPISYLDQRDGRLFHDIYPTHANAGQVSSQSSSVKLGFHSEMFFHPAPPDFLILHCLRPDPDGQAATGVAAFSDIEAALDDEDRRVLREKLFALDLARLHGTYRHHGRPIRESDLRPVVPIYGPSSPGTPARLRFEPELTTALTRPARRALANADAAAGRVAVEGKLREGTMVLLDNRRAVHSRSVFRARFDGTDRWLRRMMVGAGTSAGSTYHDRPDLELVHAWEGLGADMATAGYRAPGHGQVQS